MKHSEFFVRAVVCIAASASLSAAQARAFSSVETCHAASIQQIESLFDDWNRAVQTGDPRQVVALYAEHSALLPTLSAKPRFTYDEKMDYFRQFLALHPVGKINSSWVSIDCNSAVNTGLYTFNTEDGQELKARYTFTYEYGDGRWKITSHHSSLLPK